jgi:hypothetical protein
MYSFGLSLCHKPTSRLIKTLLVAMHIFFLLVSLVPLIADTVHFFCSPSLPGWDESECDGLAMFEGFHAMFLLPLLTTIPLVIGIYKQVRNLLQTQSLTASRFFSSVVPLFLSICTSSLSMLASGITEKAVPHLCSSALCLSFQSLTCLCYSHQAHPPFLGSLACEKSDPLVSIHGGIFRASRSCDCQQASTLL